MSISMIDSLINWVDTVEREEKEFEDIIYNSKIYDYYNNIREKDK